MEWRLADYLQIAAKTYVDVYVSHRHVVPELTPSWGNLEREWGGRRTLIDFAQKTTLPKLDFSSLTAPE